MTAITLNKAELRRKISALIHFSIRSGTAVIGQNRIGSDAGRLEMILLSADTSPNTVKNIGAAAGEGKMKVLDQDFDLAGEIGKPGVKVIGFKKSELQAQIAQLIIQYERESENER